MGLTGWSLSIFHFLWQCQGRGATWERKCRKGTPQTGGGRGGGRCVCTCTHVKILLPCDIWLSNSILAPRVIKQHLLSTLSKVFLPSSQPLPPPIRALVFSPLYLEAFWGLPVTTCVAKPAFPQDQSLCNSAQVCRGAISAFLLFT